MPCRINFRYAWADESQTTVLDEVTGLVWQRGVHPNTPEPPTRAEAVSHCEGLSLDGHEDWRLPTRVELATIDGHSVDFPLGAPFFPTPTSALWTASTAGPGQAWLLDFPTGTSLRAVGSRTNTGARCVRGMSGGATRQPLEVTAQVVRDPNTGLVWQRRLHPAQSLLGAQATCGNLVLDGATDWAVATAYELQTLIDERRVPAVDLRHFPELAGGPEVWSRTLELGVSWTVSFAQGTVQRRTVADQALPFLCVRRAAPAPGCKVCDPGCENGGLCEEQGFCTCGWTGHSGDRCEVPICTSGCPNGGFCTAPDTCTCPAGRGGPNCAVCPPGTFSTGSDTQCRPCQPGTFSAAAGAFSCTARPCGEVAPTQGATACLPCGAGRAAQPGESVCTTCGPGTIAPEGGCACGAQCGAGFEVAVDRSACQPCATGEYSEPGGATVSWWVQSVPFQW